MTTPAQRWSTLHHGIDPADVRLLRGWLSLMWRIARPLAVWRVAPNAITALGVLLALDAVLLAGSLPWAAAVAVFAAVVCDGLDGAVAVLADRVTRLGAVADALADRVADAAFAAVLWRTGVPWGLALVAGVLALTVDSVRRARPAMRSRITVAERPSWTVCAVLACGSAAVTSVQWPVLACAGAWIALGVAGLVQLSR